MALARTSHRILRAGRLSELLLTCEHASRRVPRGLRVDRRSRALLATHRGWDIGAWDVARALSARFGATAIGGAWSRLVIDLNRDPGEPALILDEADGCPVSFNRNLTSAERRRRVAALHAPYHAEIDRQLARRVAAGVPALLVSIHSFTPRLEPSRRRFDVGVLYSDHAPLARRLGRLIAAEGLSVRYNRPYSGLEGLIYAASRHGGNHARPFLEIEINQALLAGGPSRRRMAARLAPALEKLMRSGSGASR